MIHFESRNTRISENGMMDKWFLVPSELTNFIKYLLRVSYESVMDIIEQPNSIEK